MKNIFRFLMAVAVLFTASCAKEDISSSIGGGEVEVTFTANLPELGTRAYGEGKLVDILYYNVYEQGTDNKLDLSGYQKAQTQGQSLYTITLPMIKGMKYDIVFWAQVEDCGYYTLDGKTVTVNYAGEANDESRDAFFGKVVEFDPVNPGDMTSVELRRPFAQLNAITNDCQAVLKSSISEMYKSSLKVTTPVCNTLNLLTGTASGEASVEYTLGDIPAETKTIIKDETTEMHLAMNYLLVNGEKSLVDVEFTFFGLRGTVEFPFTTVELGNIPVQRNYRTNIIGKLLTKSTDFEVEIKPGFDAAYDVEGETITAEVDTAEELIAALKDDSIDAVVLGGDINLNDLLTRANNDPSLTIKSGKELTIDLNGKKLSSTSTEIGKNYNMFDVRGTLTVKNGTMEYKHLGENMGWGSSTNLFNVTAGGILNLEGVTAKNLGGSDMGFVAHLNNWGEVTLNAENCTLESNYVPVRVFNSGNDMNNVTIKNSTLKGNSAAFWVHNYTAADFDGSEDKAEAQKALLNLNIYNQGNTFSPDLNGIRYGFTNAIRTDAYGIIKTVSEDGTEVTLGSIVENGLVRRGVAGDEENTTIKKAIVGEGITTLYDRTFRHFYALETVELPSTLTTIGAAGSGVFQSCNALKNIVLPESVTVLGKGTFQECSSLESINIPAGVTRIEENCLRATGLVEVEFHAGVTYFGAQAFRDCKQLKEVVINAPEFTIEANAFGVMSGALPGTTIYVANAEMKAYLESTLAYKNQFTIVVHNSVSTADELKAALAQGGVVELNNDITLSEQLTLPAGITLNGNGKQINGTLVAGGDVTFEGHTKVTLFYAAYNNRTTTIGEGACLEMTGTDRTTLGGTVFNITGTIADAKTADKTSIQPSLIIPGGISINGANDAVFNIKNAYVQIGSTSSKNSAANGTFTINIENSIAEFTNQLTFAEPTNGMNPTFNLNVKNSVLTTGTKLCIAAPNCNMEVDNSTVTLGSYLRNSGTLKLKNDSVLTGATIQFGENGGNNGAITVDNSRFTITGTSTGNPYDGRGTGSITAKNDATVTVDYYKDMTITVDTTSTFTGNKVQ